MALAFIVFMKKIILDTDFLIHCASHMIDYEEELKRILDFAFQMYIVDKTIDELNNVIENQKGRSKSDAKLAKAILENKSIPLVKTKKDEIVDDLILDIAEKDSKDFIVATMDADLKRKLKKIGISVIIIRQKSHLELISH